LRVFYAMCRAWPGELELRILPGLDDRRPWMNGNGYLPQPTNPRSPRFNPFSTQT
jgi:hypothetical protein